MSPEHKQIVDALLANIHDRLADKYLQAQREGLTVDTMIAFADEDGVHIERRDDAAYTGVMALLHTTAAEQRGRLPVLFPLNGRTVVVWLSALPLTTGGAA